MGPWRQRWWARAKKGGDQIDVEVIAQRALVVCAIDVLVVPTLIVHDEEPPEVALLDDVGVPDQLVVKRRDVVL